MAFERIFNGPPDPTELSVGSPQSPRLGVDVVNSTLYLNVGDGWVVANKDIDTVSFVMSKVDGGTY